MELWIRSQDKEILLKVNELGIEVNMIIAFDNNKYQCLGTYKSKERALEVLDEIFDRLEDVDVIEKGTKKEVVIGSNKTYQMPEE